MRAAIIMAALMVLPLCFGLSAWRRAQSDAVANSWTDGVDQFGLARLALQVSKRPVYPYSVLPGGAYSAQEMRAKLETDPAAARHYQQFRLMDLTTVKARSAGPFYVSYRRGESIYWTRRPTRLAPGEELITDGRSYARARCGNRISAEPREPTAPSPALEPSADVMDTPSSWVSAPDVAAIDELTVVPVGVSADLGSLLAVPVAGIQQPAEAPVPVPGNSGSGSHYESITPLGTGGFQEKAPDVPGRQVTVAPEPGTVFSVAAVMLLLVWTGRRAAGGSDNFRRLTGDSRLTKHSTHENARNSFRFVRSGPGFDAPAGPGAGDGGARCRSPF